MAKSRIASRQTAKKPRPRKTPKKAPSRAMPLRTRDPVRTVQIQSHDAKPTKKKRAETDRSEGPTAAPTNGLITMLLQWSPLGVFLRQQAFFADCMSQVAQPNRR